MTTLNIRDIAHSSDMAQTEMSAVRGGTRIGLFAPILDASSFHVSNAATQMTGQAQNTYVATGVNDAWVKNIGATVTPDQSGSNSNELNVHGH
jgi:sugar (pentulose or hexulose) kinase